MFRSRHVMAVVAATAAAAVMLSCASHDRELLVDTRVRNNLRNEIIAALATNNTFETNPAVGEEGEIAGVFTKTRGLIQPHTNAKRDTLEHLQFLARIRVTRGYRDLAPSATTTDTVWNYWVIARVSTSDFPTGKFVSVYVAPSVPGHISVRELTGALAPAKHTLSMAKWHRSTAAPWATCTDNMCCCEKSSCRSTIAAH